MDVTLYIATLELLTYRHHFLDSFEVNRHVPVDGFVLVYGVLWAARSLVSL